MERSPAHRRLQSIQGQFCASSLVAHSTGAVNGLGASLGHGHVCPLRWDGWGYTDTWFRISSDHGHVELVGNRYLFSGKVLPALRPWMELHCGIDVADEAPGRSIPEVQTAMAIAVEAPNEFVQQIQKHGIRCDKSEQDRLRHAHGHTCQEIYALRYGTFKRIPDSVVYPENEQQIQDIVKAADENNVVIIPYGGGTSVSQAIMCPENEKRCIVSLDMHLVRNVEIDLKNMTATIGAGVVGKDLETYLGARGVTLGHEPDSMEFSTLGGWIATRASGMRKNKYGNIEDIVISITLVTPKGTLEKRVISPRVSHGPDLNHIAFGSEGILGVITKAVVKIRPVPQMTRYGSIIFPNFQQGVRYLYEVGMRRMQPVSIRLVDNMQFQFGMALKPPTEDWKKEIMSKIQKWYVTRHLKFDPSQMCVATLLFEGTSAEIGQHERSIYGLAARFGGVKAGEENGIRGYFLTYMIAYLRDFGFNYKFIAESFETSVAYDQVESTCNDVKQRIISCAKKLGVSKPPFVSSRVTQLYDTGACIYFYFGFVWTGLSDPVAVFDRIEHEARDEILNHGGSLSHHHGIGKLRRWGTRAMVGTTGISVLRAVKQQLDPKNIFASGNLIDFSDTNTSNDSLNSQALL